MTSRLLLAFGLAIPLAACAATPATPAGNAPAATATQTATAPAPAQPALAAPQPAAPAAAPAVVATQPHGAAAERKAAAPTVTRPPAPAPQADANAAAAPAQPGAAQPAPQAQAPAPQAGVQAQPAPQAQFTGPAAPSTGSLLQSLFALVFVLGLLAALAWFVKRFNPRGVGGSSGLRTVGVLSLGARERIVVVEVGDQWIVVGASPGRINALATMPRQEGVEPQPAPAGNLPAGFADWLKQTIDKRNAK